MADEKGKPISKATLLGEADGFLMAGKSLKDYKDGVRFFRNFVSPCIVNLSFACELYLKYLIMTQNGEKQVTGHKLQDLFNTLTEDMQKEIESDYNKNKSILSFTDCIQIHNDAFVDIRYLYEKVTDKNKSFEPRSLYNLAVALCNVSYHNHQKNGGQP